MQAITPSGLPAAGGERLVQIDSLRAIAALSVVAFHYTTRYDQRFMHTSPLDLEFPLGAMGVPLFFAISGFVIFMTIDRVRRPMDFVVWRFSRLFPAYWAAVALTWITVRLAHLPGYDLSPWEALANLTMLQSFFSIDHVDGVYWSLEVELIFYAWMLLLWVSGLLQHGMAVCAAWIGLVLAAALAERAGWGQLPFIPAYFLLVKWIPWFAMGMVAYISLRDQRLGSSHGLVVGLCLVAIGVDGGLRGLAIGVPTAIAVFLASRRLLPLLEWRPLVYVGAISYPLYLLHENIGFVAIATLERQGVAPWGAIAAAVAIALVLSSLLHHAVEMPGSKALRRLYRVRAQRAPPQTFSRPAWGAACVAALGACAVALMVTARLERSRVEGPPIARVNPMPPSASQASCRSGAPGDSPVLVIALGQSNAASHAQPGPPAAPVRVFTLAGCAQVMDPLPQTTGRGASIWTAVPALVRATRGQEIVIAPLAVESSRIEHWLEPAFGLRARLEALLAAARASGLPVLAVLWQQGESDAKHGTEARHFRAHLLELRRLIDRAGLGAPLVVARSTWCEGREHDGLRRAIESAAASGRGVLVGPDTDRLGAEYRHGCHFNAAGRTAAAKLWADEISRLPAAPDGTRTADAPS